MSEDKELKQWKEKLFYQPKNGYDRIDAEQTGEIFAYAEGYKQFLNAARTEREAVKEAIRMAEAEGFWLPATRNLCPARATPPAPRSTPSTVKSACWLRPSAPRVWSRASI